MTTNFSAKKLSKNKFSKRILAMESLENRELLSVNPLGVDEYSVPDFVQNTVTTVSQGIGTESAGMTVTVSNVQSTVANQISFTLQSAASDHYLVQYENASGASPDSWIDAVGTNTSGQFTANTNVNITITGLANGTAVKIRVITADSSSFTDKAKDLSSDWTATEVTSSKDPNGSDSTTAPSTPVYGNALTDSIVTPSGLTTSQVTITWGKPTKYVNAGDPNDGWKATLVKNAKYSVNIFDSTDVFIKTVDAGTKTSCTLTGLSADQVYKYTVTTDLTLTDPADKTATTSKTGVIVTSGTFATQKAGNAADVTVGQPTDVKATYVKGSGAKPAGVKVTWKAPANYTGGYTVTLSDGTNTITRTVNPGSKLEIAQEIADAFAAGTLGDGSDAKLAKDTRIKVVVTPIATQTIASTPTYVNTGTVTGSAIVPPASPLAPTTAALANTPGGTTVTLNAGTGSTNATVGFYVGVTAINAVPDKANVSFADLIYVPISSTGSATTVNLKAAATDYVYAFAVGADGTISDTGTIAATVATITADVTATDATNVYPVANDVKNVTANADNTVKNKYVVKWTAATDHFAGTSGSSAPTTATDFKYAVTGYRVIATIKNGVNAGISEVLYVAAGATEAEFANLRWNTKYDFKVEALVTYTTAQDATTWNASGVEQVSVGATRTGVTVAKAAAVSDNVTVAVKQGTEATITISGTTAGTNYVVTIMDANKAVLGTTTISATGNSEELKLDGTTGVIGANLTPKAKYTVTVQTVGSVPGTLSKGKIITINAANFVSATLKADTKATTINSVKVEIVAPKAGIPTGSHYLEYTNVVDAKGKADWNAAKVYTGAGTDPVAVTGTIEITKLSPNSQYFFRIVTTDAAYNNGWSDVTKTVASKEVKVKTAAVPLATITKNGFALDSNSEFGLKLVGNSMARVDALAAPAKKVLGSLQPQGAGDPLYVYTLITSVDSKADKATGQLLGAKTVAATITSDPTKTSSTDKKVTDLTGTVTFATIFSQLVINNTNFGNVKGLSVQIRVDVYYGQPDNGTTTAPNVNSEHFTLYSKASKVALPKWFV
ncbi:MAG: hypothetical protein LBI18_14460 [Planctomycetaceae bacterium]|jgi:hypothetical protein|nr:hypothetical protein [Planctomycetaceae bacterium]